MTAPRFAGNKGALLRRSAPSFQPQRRSFAFAAAIALATISSRPAAARSPRPPEVSPKLGTGATFLDHEGDDSLWVSAQQNTIFQAHPGFRQEYYGTNSLRPDAESATSGLFTVFVAYAPFRTTELIVDGEMALGGGISQALGIAGFSNLDVVRNPTLGHAPYLARAQIHQLIPLSSDWVENEDRGPLSTFKYVPRHRLELRVGKLSTADLFDINPAGSDSHLQFMNWSVDNNGAFDYAADTRGYTYGAVVEYQGPRIEVRLGEMLMPTVANGLDLDWDVGTDRADNLELEIKYSLIPDWRGTLRLLGYQNHANMGRYLDANAEEKPDITAVRQKGRTKRGFGINVIQQLAGVFRVFGRIGWNDGKNESFAYTEIDNTIEVGFDVKGSPWRRPNDQVGFAFVTNGISVDHRNYLQRGGLGFLLGDGGLSYGRETILEHYYTVNVWRGFSLAEDIQFVARPGYNRDRGPVTIFSLRAHFEF